MYTLVLFKERRVLFKVVGGGVCTLQGDGEGHVVRGGVCTLRWSGDMGGEGVYSWWEEGVRGHVVRGGVCVVRMCTLNSARGVLCDMQEGVCVFFKGGKVSGYFVILLLQLTDEDQRIYRRFNILVSDRWQAEVMGR